MSRHDELRTSLKWLLAINTITLLLGAAIIGFCTYAAQKGYGQAWYLYVAVGLGVLIVLLSFFGLYGSWKQSTRLLLIYFWTLFVLLIMQVTAGVYILFDKDEVVAYVRENAVELNLVDHEEVQTAIELLSRNFHAAAGLIFVIAAFEVVSMVLASMHFKYEALLMINKISGVMGVAVFFVGVGAYVSHRTYGGMYFSTFAMGVGVFVALVACFGYYGVKKEGPTLLAVYVWVLLLLLLVQVIGAVYVLANKQEVVDYIETYAKEHQITSPEEVEDAVELVKRNMLAAAICSFAIAFVEFLSLVMAFSLRTELLSERSGYELIMMSDR